MIQVTETTYWRLCKRYRIAKRGEINLKRHPNTAVYVLLGPIEADASVIAINRGRDAPSAQAS